MKCQFTTRYWKNWHSFSPLPAFITHLTITPPQIPTAYDSCMHFLYPTLSPNSSLSLSEALLHHPSILFTHETQRLPPLLPGFENKPIDAISSLLPRFQATDAKTNESLWCSLRCTSSDNLADLQLHTMHNSVASSVLVRSFHLQGHNMLQNEGSGSTQTEGVFKTESMKGHRFMLWYLIQRRRKNS